MKKTATNKQTYISPRSYELIDVTDRIISLSIFRGCHHHAPLTPSPSPCLNTSLRARSLVGPSLNTIYDLKLCLCLV